MRQSIHRTEYTCDQCQKSATHDGDNGWFFLAKERRTHEAPFSADLCSAKCLLAYVDLRRSHWERTP